MSASSGCDMQRVAVIGGGVSGIAAAKAFKTQGHDVLIIERSPSCGGVWQVKISSLHVAIVAFSNPV